FRAVYSEEFDMPGGQPFGLLIGNYEFDVTPRDTELLTGISIVAAAAFAPFVAAAGPEILGGEEQYPSFDRDRLDQLERARTGAAWIKWNKLRDKDESRFLGLVVPRILMRVPYRDTALRTDGFRFNEEVAGPDNSKWLWGIGAFAVGEVAIRSFHESGWLASIRGAQVGKRTGGLVTRLPACWIETDRHGVAPRSPTDVLITEQQERGVAKLGLVPLCASRDTPFPVFYSVPSLQKPKQLDQQTANTNALMSSMLQYVLCASQFARQLKVIVRDKIGNTTDPSEVERQLNEWLAHYITTVADASVETRARYPLREGLVRVVPHAARPGMYHCSIYLMPHFELDDLTAAIRLTTELEPKA
ncbi:MAG: type VI secretion system contractile sheath large subunit, partial [Planctomycetota bacterium]|nr:type VI secretion system contractile sheath large subunit [Planctomycetota bacterium]